MKCRFLIVTNSGRGCYDGFSEVGCGGMKWDENVDFPADPIEVEGFEAFVAK
jgi:hypothetical protein